LCSASAITPAACIERKDVVGETRVGQGKLYQSDNPTYDAFFEGVHAVQTQTVDAVDEEAKARAALEHALGTRNATPERLVELTKERMKRGREGTPVHVAVTGLEVEKGGDPPKKVVVSVTVPDEAAVPPSQRDVIRALEESAKSEGEIVEKFDPVKVRARQLLARHGQLVTSVNRDFSTLSRRQEVSHELGASKLVLGAAAERAEKVSTNARSFLKGIVEALPPFTDAAEPPKEEKSNVGKGGAKPKKNGAPPPKPAPAGPPPKPQESAPNPSHPAPAVPPEPTSPPPKPAPPPPSEDFNP
jgi:hypothetical protein